jgi:thioester reductase-like protein
LSGATKQGAELLLTGATGFLGKVVLHELMLRSEELGVARVHLLIRPTQRSAPETRWRTEILTSPCFAELPKGWERRIELVAGELVAPDAGIDPGARAALARRLTHVVHCAASVQFDLPLAEAAAANTTSALHVLELARECPRLASLVSVSTAYATPHADDRAPISEDLAPLPRAAGEIYASILAGSNDEDALLAETGHPNTYTLTKCLTEHLLAEGMGKLPLTLIRPSIISASLRRPYPGWIDSPAAFALFIMSIASGRMRAIIANPGARLDVVPCDAVASRIVDAAFDSRATARGEPIIRHAVAGFERSPSAAPRWGIAAGRSRCTSSATRSRAWADAPPTRASATSDATVRSTASTDGCTTADAPTRTSWREGWSRRTACSRTSRTTRSASSRRCPSTIRHSSRTATSRRCAGAWRAT